VTSTYFVPQDENGGMSSNGFKNNARAIIKGNLMRSMRQQSEDNQNEIRLRTQPYSSLQPNVLDQWHNNKESIEAQIRA
jgi:hypothetical protein